METLDLFYKYKSGILTLDEAIDIKMSIKPKFTNNRVHPSRDKDGARIKSYTAWRAMENRCYQKYQLERNPRYLDKQVKPCMREYEDYHLWFTSQFGSKLNWHVDKDICEYDNDFYSQDSCIFLPKPVNEFLGQVAMLSDSARDLPPCVTVQEDCYSLKVHGIHMGDFLTKEEAFFFYCRVKQNGLFGIIKLFPELPKETILLCLRHLHISLCHIAERYGFDYEKINIDYVLDYK